MEAESRGSKKPLGDYTRDVNEASWAGGQGRGRGQKEWAEDEAEKNFFEAEATMYEAEARHVREQLSVYEHED